MTFIEFVDDAKLGRKLRSYGYVPRNRKEAERLAPFVSAEAVESLSRAYRDAGIRDLLSGANAAPEAGVCLLALAADREDLSPTTRELAGETLAALALRLRDETDDHWSFDQAQRYRFWETLALFPEVPAAAAARGVIDAVYRELPADPALAWANDVGLDVPSDRSWGVRIVVPAVGLPSVDLDVQLTWTPERLHQSFVRLANHWWSTEPEHIFWRTPASRVDVTDPQEFDLRIEEDGASRRVQGLLSAPVTGPWDLRRILTDIEAVTELRFDPAQTKVNEDKGRRSTNAVRRYLTS